MVAVVTMLLSLEHTVLNVTLPTLQRQLGASSSELTWVVDGFLLPYAGLVLTTASLGDRFGRRRSLIAGLVIFAASSLACGFVHSPLWLIAGRVAMGVGGALILPTTLSTIRAVFPVETSQDQQSPQRQRPGAREYHRAMALWSAAFGLGVALGPVAGGLVVQHLGWRWIFWGMAPIAGLLLAFSPLVPPSKDNHPRKIDVPGSVLSVLGLGAVLWALIEAPSFGWRDHWVLGAFAAGAALLLAFLVRELKAKSPMLEMSLLKDRRFGAPALALALTFFGLMGALYVLTIYLQVVRGYDPVKAGLTMLSVAGPMIAVSAAGPLAQRWRYGPKLTVTLGLLVIAAGMWLESRTTPASGYQLTLEGLATIGAGIGLAQAPATASLMTAVRAGRAGVGSAMNDQTRLVGGLFGVAVLSTVVSSIYRARIAGAVTSLPTGFAGAARDRIESAVSIASRIGGVPGRELQLAAVRSYIDGMDRAAMVAAFVAVGAAAWTLLALPGLARRLPYTGRHAAPARGHWKPRALDAAWPLRPLQLSEEGPTVNVHDTDFMNPDVASIPGRETVILVTGLGMSAGLVWGGVVPLLSKRYRCVAIDLRGQGYGPRDHSDTRHGVNVLERCADDIVAVMDALAIEKANLLCWSAGGAVGQLFAYRYGDRLHRLVLSGTAERFSHPHLRRVSWLPRPLFLLISPLLFKFHKRAYPGPARADIERAHRGIFARFAHQLGRFNSSEWIGTVKVPAAVVVMQRDKVIRPKRQMELALDLLAEVVYVRGSHYVPLTGPDRFARGVEDALDRLEPSATPQPAPTPDATPV